MFKFFSLIVACLTLSISLSAQNNTTAETVEQARAAVASAQQTHEQHARAAKQAVAALKENSAAYQGVDGRYQLHYDIDEAGLHNMIVTGEFDNIITASPLLEKLSAETRNRILSNVSDDSYFYHYVLKTEKELTFRNSLAFLYGSDRHGFSFDYRYDISADKQTVKFKVSDDTKQAISTALENAKEYVKKLLPGKK